MSQPPKAGAKANAEKGAVDAERAYAINSTATHYEETQNDEIEVLRSIYMDDFESVETKAAWSRTEKSFNIRLRPYSEPSGTASILLCATLNATYPKSPPTLSLKDFQSLRETTLNMIRKVIVTKPKELLGEVMIYEIAVAIQDILEDAVTHAIRDRKMPSLEEERTMSEAAAAKVAQEKQEEMLLKEQEEKAEEERKMQRLLEEDRARRQDARRDRRVQTADAAMDQPNEYYQEDESPDDITFDQSMVMRSYNGLSFQSVHLISRLGLGFTTKVFLAKPKPVKLSSPFVVLKRARVAGGGSKLSVLKLERELEKLKQVYHENVLNVLGFRIDTGLNEWGFDVLVEYSYGSSLKSTLGTYESLPVQKVRSSMIDLLQALDFYHKNDIVHGNIHPGNIFFHETQTSEVKIKVADAQFQATLRAIGAKTYYKSPSYAPLPATWLAPDRDDSKEPTRKTDIWDIGVLIVQMLFGLNAPQRYQSPTTFMNGANLTEPFQDFVRDVFQQQPNKRPSAFDLIPYEFLRTDVNATSPETSLMGSRIPSSANLSFFQNKKPRQSSNTVNTILSRYTSEWDEAARLGKGGYGEVVKARNKLDGRIYAIKKIINKTPSELSQVLSEVYLLATLNHPYVVRYYTAWPEEEQSTMLNGSDNTLCSSETSYLSPENDTSLSFAQSTGGLDFISSSGYPKIEFGDENDSDEESDEENNDNESDVVPNGHESAEEQSTQSLNIQRTRSASRPTVRSTLFIQMEYCERLTLRDVIRKGLSNNSEEIWRLLRQVLEGLAHIHSHGIIHRDLKPENIFIDVADNPKIGDFGLAKSGTMSVPEKVAGSGKALYDDMTRSVGTTLYVAPELKSNASGSYNAKVDMYSLGIILFEMCHAIKTGMERLQVIGRLREETHPLPPDLQAANKAPLAEIIQSLVKHRPSERPSSAELLQSGKLPVQMEDETVRLALKQLSDPHSPYHYKMMAALFAQSDANRVKNHFWKSTTEAVSTNATTNYLLSQKHVKNILTACFERHGAVEVQRETILPLSDYYTGNANVVQLLDEAGTLVQLPYDLTLPHAKCIAEQVPAYRKMYTFGTVYRRNLGGGAPRSSKETDFDIVGGNSKDLALEEAEVIKVTDEVLQAIPALKNTPMCFHLSHSDLLEMIMEFCRISTSQRAQVKEILGKLNIQEWTWSKIRNELRAPSIGISTTSLDEMAQFDFRDSADKCFAKLQTIFKGTVHLPKLHSIFTHISGLVEYLKRMKIKHKVYCSPLSSYNDMYYKGGIMFQCLFDTKKKDVLAAGGRYDSLVEAHQSHSARPDLRPNTHAVGVKIAWDRLVTLMVRYEKSNTANTFLRNPEQAPPDESRERRCDCLVASFDPSVLRLRGVQMVADLWAQDISGELAVDTGSPEELSNLYKDDKHSWIIIIKNESMASGKPDLKIKSIETKEDSDVRSADLFSYLRAEFREREQREGTPAFRAKSIRGNSHTEQQSRHENSNPVQVLTSNHKSKKANKYKVVEAAQNAARESIDSYSESPVASIETKDEYLDMIQGTKLSDPESWRRVIQDVPLQDRMYLQDVHKLIESFKTQYGDARKCFIYNFRTSKCVDYDLRL